MEGGLGALPVSIQIIRALAFAASHDKHKGCYMKAACASTVVDFSYRQLQANVTKLYSASLTKCDAQVVQIKSLGVHQFKARQGILEEPPLNERRQKIRHLEGPRGSWGFTNEQETL